MYAQCALTYVQIAKVLIVVHVTANDELVWNVESDILWNVAIAKGSALHKETRHANRLWRVRLE